MNYKNRCAAILLSALIALLMIACAEEYLFWFGGSRIHQYICPNGSPHHYRDEQENVIRCVSCDEGYVITNDDRCDTALTVSAQPMLNGEATATTATFSLTSSEDVALWWVVYDGDVTIDDAQTIINDAPDVNGVNAGISKASGSSGIAIFGDESYDVEVEGLTASTGYTFYATIRKNSTRETFLFDKLNFMTASGTAFAHVCADDIAC